MSHRPLPLAATALLLLSTIARGAAPAPSELHGDPVSGVFGDLSSLAFDHDGALWIGNRYAGIFVLRDGRFTLFDVYNTPIPDGGITAIHVDKNNTKWFGTGRGYLYSFDNRRWQVFPTSTRLGQPAGAVTCIRADAKGTIWFGTHNGGLWRLENGEVEVIYPRPTPSKAQTGGEFGWAATKGLGEVFALDIDRRGRLWAGGRYALTCYDGRSWTWFTDREQPNLVIFCLWCNPKNDEVYLATSDGLYRFRDGNYRKVEEAGVSGRADTVRGTPDGRVAAVYFHPGGAIDGDGLHFRRYAEHSPLAEEFVKDVAFDKQGRIWFACHRNGLVCLDGEKWETFAPVRSDDFQRVATAQAVLQRNYPHEIVREQVADADIHDVLKDPRKYAGKKIRIVGAIASGFEYAQMLDSHGEGLGISPEYACWFWDFVRAEGLETELSGKAQLNEFVGYLDWGGYFGHMGGSSRQFTIVEIYPAGADKARKAEIKRLCLKYLDGLAADLMIPDLIQTPDISRALEALQGAWTVTDIKNQQWLLRGDLGSRWTIVGNRLTTGAPGDWSRGKLRIDPRRTPAAIDCYVADSPFHDLVLCGIYCLERDTLKVCWSTGRSNTHRRPREFAADRNSQTELFTLRREPGGPVTPKPADNEPTEPDDPEAIAALEKSSTRLEHDDQGNVVAADFGFIQVEGSRLITDKHFAPLKKLHHLERVNVANGQLTDAGLECLAHCRRLVRLDIGGEGITDAGLEYLGGLSRLESLWLV